MMFFDSLQDHFKRAHANIPPVVVLKTGVLLRDLKDYHPLLLHAKPLRFPSSESGKKVWRNCNSCRLQFYVEEVKFTAPSRLLPRFLCQQLPFGTYLSSWLLFLPTTLTVFCESENTTTSLERKPHHSHLIFSMWQFREQCLVRGFTFPFLKDNRVLLENNNWPVGEDYYDRNCKRLVAVLIINLFC